MRIVIESLVNLVNLVNYGAISGSTSAKPVKGMS